MSIGFRFRAYPSATVARTLRRWIGCQRFIYNAKVREDRYFRTLHRKSPALTGNLPGVDQAYSHLIGDGNGCAEADTTWLREVPSHVLRNGATRFGQAYQRFFKKLGRRPTIQDKHGQQSVWLTNELFRFEPVPRRDAKSSAKGRRSDWKLVIGTKKFPCGELPFHVNVREGETWAPPKSIHVTVNAGRWHVSFSNETDEHVPDPESMLKNLRACNPAELAGQTIGIDRGITVPVVVGFPGGNDRAFGFEPVQLERMARKEVQRRRWQRIAARRQKGSGNRREALDRAARAQRYSADVRNNLAHQASRALVDLDARLLVFEALKIKDMTRSAKGTLAAPGQNVRQKSGLNRAILGSAWGALRRFTKYKAEAAGKLVIEVPAFFSSQECSACGHIHEDNRPTQAVFVCQRCEHAENADVNASRVIAKRGVKAIVSGSYTLKSRKKIGPLRLTTSKCEALIRGSDGSESGQLTLLPTMPVEAIVSRRGPGPSTQMPVKQETPPGRRSTFGDGSSHEHGRLLDPRS